jgi:hypothetical protein
MDKLKVVTSSAAIIINTNCESRNVTAVSGFLGNDC